MSWAVELLDRETGRFLNSPDICQPISLSWDGLSGPSEAVVNCPCDHLGLNDWRLRLGQEVRVYDPQGRLSWWGYLHQVSLLNGEFQHTVSLRNVANRVAVRYQNADSTSLEAFCQTEWLDDMESQAVYGIKELLVKADHASRSSAEWTAAVLLRERAWPKIEIGHNSPLAKDGEKMYQLHCRGWLDTLDWRIWPGVASIISHAATQQGTQPLGNTLANRKIAQSFQLKDPLGINSLAVRLRKHNNPPDDLRLSLQTTLLVTRPGSNLVPG